jgi:hypothetical protein
MKPSGGVLLVAGAFVSLAGLVGGWVLAAQETTAASYTGCLNANSGTLVALAQGDAPLMPCGNNQIQVRLGSGDITTVSAGTGLQGGSMNGAAVLSIEPSYRLPQACENGNLAMWTGTAWSCGTDADTDPVAFGGFDIAGEGGIPNTLATIRKLLLPAGKYAVFAKISIAFDEADADFAFVSCRLIAESEVDEGTLFRVDHDANHGGVLSLTLLHQFAGEGFAEIACEDMGGEDDFSDAHWSNLRITAIRLGSFQNGPLLLP